MKQTKKVKDLKKGDKVTLATNEVVRITDIGKGWFENSSLCDLSNGNWFCLPNKERVGVLV